MIQVAKQLKEELEIENPVNPFDVKKTIWDHVNESGIKLEVKALESKFYWKETKVQILKLY